MQKAIQEIRQKIPAKNLPSFDASAVSVLAALKTTPERYDELADFLWRRVQLLQARDLSQSPPALAPLPGESVADTFTRELEAAGFREVTE